MPGRKSVEVKLSELDELAAQPERTARAAALQAATRDPSSRVAAKAARLAADGLYYELIPELTAAFRRFLDKPVKSDPACLAKKALARALVALDCDDVEFFLEGLGCRQPEPVWGGSADTAADVRCSCAMGLVRSGYPRALLALIGLLHDPEAAARLGAVRAVACGTRREAELLLRAKVLAGDPEPAVLGESFVELLAVAPDESVEFVARFLKHDDETLRELAALALGESRLDAALEPLKAAWKEPWTHLDLRSALVRAAAAHRSPAAHDWLMKIVDEADVRTVARVVDALAAFRHDGKLLGRLKEVLERRADRSLLAQYAKLVGDDQR